jgi:hypothetical protein
LRIPPYHWWRTVFFLIPAISVYTIVLGAASIVSSLLDRRGYFAHGCARAWSWLILKTTGVSVRVDGMNRIAPGTTYVFVSNHQSIYDIPVIFASLPVSCGSSQGLLARFRCLAGTSAQRASVRRSSASRPCRYFKRWRPSYPWPVSDHLLRNKELGRSGRAVQGWQFPARDRQPADRAARSDRHAPGHAEGRLRTEPADVAW